MPLDVDGIWTWSELKFDSEQWYPEQELRVMGFDGDILKKARKSGELRCRELSRHDRLYKGEWILAWLEGGDK